MLIHEGSRIPLGSGQTLIGRALHCHLRFNDPSISREHMRISVDNDGAVAENLSRTNGTRVNDRVIVGPHRLRDGDTVRIGFRRLVVLVDRKPASASAPGEEMPLDQEQLAGEATRPGDLPVGASPRVALPPLPSLVASDDHNCPRCRALVSASAEMCPSCGYEWPFGRPASVTQEIDARVLARRQHPRHAVELPVLYQSEALTIDGIVRDISLGGLFIASEILDPVGTRCELTVLPDGHPAVVFPGVVAHVRTEGGPRRLAGMGIQFLARPAESVRWLEGALRQRPSESP